MADPTKPTPLHVLLVEDNEHDTLAVKRAFAEGDPTVECSYCQRGEEALEALGVDGQEFDIVITDFKLPGISGVDLCHELTDRGIKVPLVLLTGSGSENVAVEALKAGAYDYVIKDPDQGYLELLPFVVRDVVQRHQDRVLRRQAEDALIAATRKAEKASVAKSEFLAAMSHDLRTPLNAILGFSDILSNQYFGPISEKYLEYVEDIQTSGEHLLTLVNEILDLSTIEAGKQSLVKEKLDAQEIIAECVKIVGEKAYSSGIKLITEASDNLPPLYADRRATKQILLNLLSNAVKFTPTGGKITVSAKASKRNITLKIADTGRGIPAENIPKLTDPFIRVDDDPYLSEKGWGLGLSITKSLVDLHNGKLDIKSKVGKGTTVTVTFPNSAS